ncbi:MAG: hypothetical protein ACRD2S_00895 [Terriglobales bacterium]
MGWVERDGVDSIRIKTRFSANTESVFERPQFSAATTAKFKWDTGTREADWSNQFLGEIEWTSTRMPDFSFVLERIWYSM